jgi:hypothetical protein
MKFSLVFDNSGDTICFDVVYNQDILEYFVNECKLKNQNSFSNKGILYKELDKKITNMHWALSKTNEVLYDLTSQSFVQHTNLENYLDQNFLNQTHCAWVFSQQHSINIDQLRFSANKRQAELGNILHEMYPDEIREVALASVLEKLGYIFPYEEVNMAVHRLESSFNQTNLEFSADSKWQVFPNPYKDTMISNNDVVNFCFGYTYVGRQYYNKFEHFDSDLLYKDHYNYETLEFSFQLNLQRPQTIPYSSEFLAWAKTHNVPLISTQIPVANIPNLEQNLFEYRKILYRNSRDNNRAKIVLH